MLETPNIRATVPPVPSTVDTVSATYAPELLKQRPASPEILKPVAQHLCGLDDPRADGAAERLGGLLDFDLEARELAHSIRGRSP